jgi:ADP-heptose:LPS heptosyltransferase
VEILVLHPGGLGDTILSLPAIDLLRKRFPNARLTIAGNVDHLAAVGVGYAERTVSLSTLPLHSLYAPGKVPEAEARFWKSFDRIVSWTGAADPEFARKLNQLNPGALVASWRPGPQEPRHVAQLFVDSLGPEIHSGAGVEPADIVLDPGVTRQGVEWLAGRGWNGQGHLAALHPGAGSRLKRWPLPRFVELARRLALQENARLLIVEGPADSGLATQMEDALPGIQPISARSLPLSLLAGLIAKCRVFAGNDSGIAHLAAGLGVRTVVLFGPTLPQHWAPLGRHVTALRDARGCEACASTQGEHTCLSRISVEEVLTNMASAGS